MSFLQNLDVGTLLLQFVVLLFALSIHEASHAWTADYFGENNNATNYGLVYSSKLVSVLVGAGLGAVVVDTWGYGAAFGIAGSVGIVCAFLSILLRQPKLKYRVRKRRSHTITAVLISIAVGLHIVLLERGR